MKIKTSGADHSMPSKPLTHLQRERAELSLSPAHSQMIFPILNLFFFFLQAMLAICAWILFQKEWPLVMSQKHPLAYAEGTLVIRAFNITTFFPQCDPLALHS